MNSFNTPYFTEKELKEFGFKAVGKNVRIAKNCTIHGVENISIGDNVRIDGFTTIISSGGFLTLGSFIHIGGYSFLSAGSGITFDDFSGTSQGVRIYSKSDDYTGDSLPGPMVDKKYSKVITGEVTICRHVIIGSGSIVLPGVKIGVGSAVGALSLVTKNLPEWGVYFGSPAKKIKNRSKKILNLESEFLTKLKRRSE